MKNSAPHYLLITETKTIIEPREDGRAVSRRSGQWRFVLEQMGVEARIEVADEEPNVFGERLELLAVVRSLESLEQSSRVTLLTSSRYVSRGIRQGMNQWRANEWKWERFGAMTLVKNHDLWRRVDHALGFHMLECRLWDIGRLTSHTNAASASRANSSSIALNTSRTDPPHRRSNVIRLHADRVPTVRKPIEPQQFVKPKNLIKTKLVSSLPISSHAELDGPESSPNPSDSLDAQRTQLAECAAQAGSMARVKPPRAGRAYGYAVN